MRNVELPMKRYLAGALLAGAVAGLGSSTALADVCLTVGGHTQNLSHGTQGTCTTSAETSVIPNHATNSATGTGLAGTVVVDFSSTWPAGTTSFLDFASGNASIKPDANGHNASFPDLTIDVPGYTFTDIVFGLQMQNLDATSLTITALDGTTVEGSWSLTGLSHSQDQQFDVVASNGQVFTELVLSAGVGSGIKEAKQFEISGLTEIQSGGGTPAPEPSTWAMMLLGFAGLGFAGYRKTKSGLALAA